MTIQSAHLCFAFYLQIGCFHWWACLDSNQRPLPYQRQLHMLCMFAVVQKYLQIPIFYFYGRSACSLLFRCVVVKLSSVLRISPRYEAHLSRQLYKAMHELEALQLRRRGGVAPLARLDVDGVDS